MMRRGFTLVEILVSLMIFTVVSVAMLGIMLMASDIYRRGEAGRSANDEAVAVMAALDEDLSRLVPAADNGWFYASLIDANGDVTKAGDSVLAFIVTPRDRSLITSKGERDRTIVAWWLKHETLDLDGSGTMKAVSVLYRGEGPAPVPDPAVLNENETALDAIMMLPAAKLAQITTGCLHFGTYIASRAGGRSFAAEWLEDAAGVESLPNRTVPTYDSATQGFPSAIRITTVLTGGGRFAARGRVVGDLTDTATSLRVVGIPSLSTQPGSMVRVSEEGDPAQAEWIGYRGYANGRLDCTDGGASDPLVGRGRRRSEARAFTTQAVVEVGQAYTLVRTLPH